MSGYPMDGQNPYYGDPGQPIMQPNTLYPPGQQPYYPPQSANQPFQAQTNFQQPFPQYGAPMGQIPPNQPYYNQPMQQQQQNQRQGCCDTLSVMLAGLCAGMLCYMCLCEEGMGEGCCNEGMMEDGHTGDSLMGFDD